MSDDAGYAMWIAPVSPWQLTVLPYLTQNTSAANRQFFTTW